MEFERREAPHLAPTAQVSTMMLHVLVALVPAAMAHVWYFGPGFIFNLIVAAAACVGGEAFMTYLRGREPGEVSFSSQPVQDEGVAFAPVDRFEPKALTHMLVVTDAQASRDWYVEVLEASVYGEYGGTSVVLELLGNWLLLVTGGEPTPDKPDVTLQAPLDPGRVSAQIIFRVDDCAGTYELLRRRGAEFLAEPLDRGGEIRAFFRDPDGHLYEISELT